MLILSTLGLLIALSYGTAAQQKLEAQASPPASMVAAPISVDHAYQTTLDGLVAKLAAMEKRLAISEAALLASTDMSPQLKEQLVSTLQARAIEDDVQQNKEDIVDLRVTDGRHDMLLSQEMSMINYINNTIIPSLDHKVDLKVEELHEYDSFIDATRPPIGSIIAWMPAYSAKAEIPSGWQRCDGSAIKLGPMAGTATPNLNAAKLFMRGSSDESAGTVEDDSVQDHQHADPGHTHSDSGHSHSDNGHTHYEDSSGDGHYPIYMGSDEAHHEDVVCTRYVDKLGGCGGYFVKWNSWTVESAKASITTNSASIQASNTGIGGMSTGKKGGETRPKNMNVVYIIRVQ